MSGSWPIVCDSAELAVECARAARELELALEPRVVDAGSPQDAAEQWSVEDASALALSRPPSPTALVHLAAAAERGSRLLPLAVIGDGDGPEATRDLARDLGLAAVAEVRPLLSLLALLECGAQRPWTASSRDLPELDRSRLASVLSGSERSGGELTRADDGRLAYRASPDASARTIGETRDVGAALAALGAAEGVSRPPMPHVEGVDPQQVLDVIFGPQRALSDPASKSALQPYDLPLPLEELCATHSRAASEASRIGFPVRIALASPDLRVWDHPDLAADAVDNAARVRDVFRQIMALAQSRAPDARLLGVTVSATTPARALLRVRATPLPDSLVLTEIGFADPHGLVSDDRTCTVLPASVTRLERVLSRLQGSALLLEGNASERRQTVNAISDVLLRLAAFAHDWRKEIESVAIEPLAMLMGGGVEVREACVTVGDAFERSLDAPVQGRPA